MQFAFDPRFRPTHFRRTDGMVLPLPPAHALEDAEARGHVFVLPGFAAFVEEEAHVEATTEKKKPKRKQRGRKIEQTPVYLTHPHLPLSERFLMYKLPLSPKQVADEVDTVLDTIYRWIRAGTLPSRPAGRFIKCDQGPLANWAEKRAFLPADQREAAS